MLTSIKFVFASGCFFAHFVENENMKDDLCKCGFRETSGTVDFSTRRISSLCSLSSSLEFLYIRQETAWPTILVQHYPAILKSKDLSTMN